MKLRILTLNTHKGFSLFPRRFTLLRLCRTIHAEPADIIFLQEVVGKNSKKAAKYAGWPREPHHEFLAKDIGFNHIYGKNVVYTAGHHGNAILTRFPILSSETLDISTNSIEKKGILYGKIKLPGKNKYLHCICVHLGLFGAARKKQFRKLSDYIQATIPKNEPLVVAGDFNEWRKNKKNALETVLNLQDAGLSACGKKLRTFPSALPLLPLDRIYLRGFKTARTEILHKHRWANISDHAALAADAECD